MPFMVSLFVPDEISYLSVTLLGLIVGTTIVLISIGLIIKTNTELPPSQGAEMINKLLKTPSGIAVSSLGEAFLKSFSSGVY